MDEIKDPSRSAATPPLSEEDRLLLEEADSQYIGTYSHGLDLKGRLVVPQAFRTMLGPGFYIAPTRDLQAVGLYSKLNWAKMRRRYAQLDPVNDDVLGFLEIFTSMSFRDQECDGQGRILLPTIIRELILGSDKELIVSGEMDHVRIMSAEKYNERFNNIRSSMADRMKAIDRLRMRDLASFGQEGR